MKQIIILLFFISSGSLQYLQAQSIPVGLQTIEDNIRRQQLDAGSYSNLSFCIRPLYHFKVQKDSAFINETSFKTYPKKPYMVFCRLVFSSNITVSYPMDGMMGP